MSQDRAPRTSAHRCKHCRISLIPTYAVANNDECVSCLLKKGKRTNLAKGSYACFLNSINFTNNEMIEHKIDGNFTNPF